MSGSRTAGDETTTQDSSDASDPALRTAVGIFTGFLLLAIVDAVAITIVVPMPRAGLALRAAHYFYDAAETLGIGALAAIALGIGRAHLPKRVAPIAYVAAATLVAWLSIVDDLYRGASLTPQGRFGPLIFVFYLALGGAAIPTAHAVAERLSRRPRLRWVAAAVGLAGMIVDHLAIRDDNFASHAFAAGASAVFAGIAIAPVAERAARALAKVRAGRVAIAATASIALFGVGFSPSNAARYELFRQPCALAPWVLAATVWRTPRPHAEAAPPSSAWFRDRAGDPPVPPTPTRLLAASPVIVLITVDALRADAVSDPANEALFPVLTSIKRGSAMFTRASAPGSQTTLTLATVFSGRYFSEMRWARYGVGATRFHYPAEDPSPRFPQILTDHGVATAEFASVIFLGSDFGIARGFGEEKVLARGTYHAHAKAMIDPLVDRLRRAGGEPLFLFTHLMEPHAPYDRGRKDGTKRERYLSEIAVADAQIGRVKRMLEGHFGDRWMLVITADHGESFGDHQTFEHGKTLYEELVHVPLLVMSPRIQPRTIDQRVSLVDLGPTFLDLFGVDTPAHYQGQSLVPLLAGQSVTLTRPIVAEGRLRRALTQPDGLKVIEDPRRKIVEVYDLSNDPGETRNLFDLDPARADPALTALRAFFAHHALTQGGYRPPYKP